MPTCKSHSHSHSHSLRMRLGCLSAITITTATAALLWTPAAQAQSAGAWLLRAGATQIRPNVVSGNLSAPSLAGTTADIEPNSQISGGVTHMLTDHWALDLPFAVPFTHDLVGTGAIAAVGKIGDTHVVPATLLGQYRLGAAEAPVRPYLGAGLTYANFYKERSTAALSGVTGGSPDNPTTFKVKSKFALSVQVGVSVALKNQWFIDASLVHTFLKTRSTLSTGQTLDATLNPDVISVGLGYRF